MVDKNIPVTIYPKEDEEVGKHSIWEILLRKRLRQVGFFSKKIFTPVVLFILILSLGIFARTWHFRELPPGLTQDEASLGMESYDLLHFGVDRNGMSYPVSFISWGDGMSVLSGYVLIPFMEFGLTPFIVRLPNLLEGILTLPLVFWIAKRIWGIEFGLLVMFLLAISPWHILMSRYAIDENMVPFMFALGFATLLLSNAKNIWFIISAILFGLCFYTYGAMYLAVPVFLFCAIPILVYKKRVSRNYLIIGLVIFLLVITPIFLFIVVNALGLNSIHLGPMTIPRFPQQARFLTVAATSNTNPFLKMIDNTRDLVKLLLIYQSDGYVQNAVVPFGYLYNFSLPLAIIGVLLLISTRKSGHGSEQMLLLAWLIAATCIGIFQLANINRMHLIFIPIIFCTGVFLIWLGKQQKLALAVMILVYLVSFIIFYNVYQGSDYRQQANGQFYAGIIPALDAARQIATGGQNICVTDKIAGPYIFVLFIEKENPSIYLPAIRYEYPDWHSGPVLSLGRYYFGMANCPKDTNTIYVLTRETPPKNGITYQVKNFIGFQDYFPETGTP